MSEHDRDAVDRLLSETLGVAGLDPEVTRRALADMQEAFARQMAFMKGAKYKRRVVEATCRACSVKGKFTLPQADPDVVARAAVSMAKAADAIARLEQFLAGRPDSRPDDGREWLRGLTDEQLRVVQGWVEANGRGKERG